MYIDKLPEGISLQIFLDERDEKTIFESSGKWLYPLFEFEDYLKNNYKEENFAQRKFCSNDSAIGKAAAALSIFLGIKKIHAKIASERAIKYIDFYNEKNELYGEDKIIITYDNLVPKILCKTEDILCEINDEQEIYKILCERAGRKN